MTDRDRASDLEFWSGRGRGGSVGQDPEPLRKPYRTSRFARLPFRVPAIDPLGFRRSSFRLSRRLPTLRHARLAPRPVAAAALLAVLTGAWLFVGHQSHPAPSTLAAAPVSTSSSEVSSTVSSTRPVDARTDPMARPAVVTPRCAGLTALRPHVGCTVDGVIMDIALYTPATVGAVFRRVSGAQARPGSGPARCGLGRPDERAWSVAAAPLHAVGRYVCRLEAARAVMWWTHGDRLLHALAGNPRDSDLAKLFAWWLAHPSA